MTSESQSGFRSAVVSGASMVLAHTPGLVMHGSKPSREVSAKPALRRDIQSSLRTYDEAKGYAPHQALIGSLHPRKLPERPWFGRQPIEASRSGPHGEIIPESEFLSLLAVCDEFGLVRLDQEFLAHGLDGLARVPLAKLLDLERASDRATSRSGSRGGADSIPFFVNGESIGAMHAGHDQDASLSASVLLENLACKASGVLAVLNLLDARDIDPSSVDFVIGCAEEAVGDRYQRGGGNMGKAIASATGLVNASGMDVKNFCAGPISAIVTAASLVSSGVFDRILVVGGGSSPKLGMKFEGHLRSSMPILEDVVAAVAVVVERDDRESPVVRLDGVGVHRVRDGGANPQVMASLVQTPLQKLDRSMMSVDEFVTELHNPEITEPQGSGNVPERNYRTLAALAVAEGQLDREEIGRFVAEKGLPGYAPTQGHIASAVCYVPHAVDRIRSGEASSIQFLAKGSLFLGRMSQIADGISVLLEQNPSVG